MTKYCGIKTEIALLCGVKWNFVRAALLLIPLAVPLSANSAAAQECLLDTNDDGDADDSVDTIAGANASGIYALACGDSAVANGIAATALGTLSEADSDGTTAIGADTHATAIAATAVGGGARAEDSLATAIGAGAEAAEYGSLASGSLATASGSVSAAIGYDAQADETQSSALGGYARATATGSTAVGSATWATGEGSTTVGLLSSASGENSTALGRGANATNDNSTAIGAGATTTADNQVTIGTASNTLTVSGVTSQASRNAQSGAIEYLTSDAAGNIATDGGALNAGLDALAQFGSDFATFQNELNSLQDQIDRLATRNQDQIDENTDGVALAMAMAGSGWLMPDEKFAMTANWGYYGGSNGVAFSGAARLSRNASFNAGVGFGTKKGEVGARAGVRIGW